MNRIILIGNGFDLAHGLKTSYTDFINDFWEQKIKSFLELYRKDIILYGGTIALKNYEDNDIIIESTNFDTILKDTPREQITICFDGYSNSLFSKVRLNKTINNLQFKNRFLKRITEKHLLQNWVDFEEEYYSALNECLEGKFEGGVEKLNNNFLMLKTALINYLKKQVPDNINLSNDLKWKIYYPSSKERVPTNDKDKYENILFLNFNYTNTANLYLKNSRTDKIIHIHGELENENNPIIFGYGDEIDDNYKIIEKEKNNEFLKNIKSFGYSRTNNYREMLNFINADEYQIYVMGHSCGTSDRTLLNTLFEHNNCKSIKIFYHKIDDKQDNYLDVYMNMSRSFTNKAKMRDIVISWENSKPLIG